MTGQKLPPVRQEMDDEGNHRIVAQGRTGDWTSYDSIASLKVNGRLYIAATRYYAGVLPIECVLRVEYVYEQVETFMYVKGVKPN